MDKTQRLARATARRGTLLPHTFPLRVPSTQWASTSSRTDASGSSTMCRASHSTWGGITNPVSAQNGTVPRPNAQSPTSRKPRKPEENAVADWAPEAEVVGSNPFASAGNSGRKTPPRVRAQFLCRVGSGLPALALATRPLPSRLAGSRTRGRPLPSLSMSAERRGNSAPGW